MSVNVKNNLTDADHFFQIIDYNFFQTANGKINPPLD
jgi:hypothetical protein